MTKLHAKSGWPAAAGAVAGILVSFALTLVMAGAGFYRDALAGRAAREAKLIALQEQPFKQLASLDASMAFVPGTEEPQPVQLVAASMEPPRKLPQMGEAFIDRFVGDRLDEGRWYISDGWSNGDWMENDWRRSQISVAQGVLRLAVSRSDGKTGKPLAGSEIQTHELFRYGYFETRMRLPRDPGLITAAFTFVKRDPGKPSNEIDIEILGRATSRVELTIHESNRSTAKKMSLPFDSADGFHTYGIDWQPDRVRWYAEGKLIHEERGRPVANLTRPQKFILSLWATKKLHQWAGEIDPAGGPWSLDVACVAYAPEYRGKPLCD